MLKKLISTLTFTVIMILVLTSAAFAVPADVRGHWGEDYIATLLDQNIMGVYDNGQFKPNQAITRAEFAESLAKALYLEKIQDTDLTDIASHPAKGYIAALVKEGIVTGFPNKTFQPEQALTRAQVVTMLTRALGLDEKSNQINMHSFSSFLDLPADHWASKFVKMASELDILNGYPDGSFRPSELTTRAEAAKMIGAFKTFNTTSGFVADVYPTSNKIAISPMAGGERTVVSIADTALIGRNNRLVSVTDFLKTDKVFVISDSHNRARYVKAYGLITKADLVEEVSQMTNYVIEPFEVEALAKGDYNVVKPKMIGSVTTKLLDSGLTPSEVEAMLNKDWNSLESQGKEHLGEAIAEKAGLPLDMLKALMAKDWEKVKALAKVEALQRAVRVMVNSDLLS